MYSIELNTYVLRSIVIIVIIISVQFANNDIHDVLFPHYISDRKRLKYIIHSLDMVT